MAAGQARWSLSDYMLVKRRSNSNDCLAERLVHIIDQFLKVAQQEPGLQFQAGPEQTIALPLDELSLPVLQQDSRAVAKSSSSWTPCASRLTTRAA